MSQASAATGIHSINEPADRHHTQQGILPTSSHTDVSAISPSLSPDSSTAVSDDDSDPHLDARLSRPKLGSRKSSGTMIVPRDGPTVIEEDYEQGDMRTMSPRRSSEEVDRLGEEARLALIEQARILQNSLQAIVDRVESVKTEHERLEGGNKFLQSYIGELMQTSRITSAASSKKGKGVKR